MFCTQALNKQLRNLPLALIVLAMLGCSVFADDSAKSASRLPASDSISKLDTLVDIAGKNHKPFESPDTRAAVLIFVLADCPISNSYSSEYNRLLADYGSKGISIYLVHPDPHVNKEVAAKHARDYDLKPPVVLDPQHRVVKMVGATVTPEAAVISRKGSLLYLGRIDDRYVDLGKRAERVDHAELRDALDAVLNDRPIIRSHVKAIGCSIADLN